MNSLRLFSFLLFYLHVFYKKLNIIIEAVAYGSVSKTTQYDDELETIKNHQGSAARWHVPAIKTSYGWLQ